jgi:hypothetical protein
MKTLVVAAASAAALGLSACGNALYFYETGKLSLTLEARPDSSQPVQGNLGFKQRTAVVAPPKKNGKDPTDSSAMISAFRVHKADHWMGWGPLTIETALVTGRPAIEIDRETAQRTAAVVAGVGIATYDEIGARSVVIATEKGQLDRLKQLAAIEWSDLTDAEKAELGRITDTFSQYDADLHASIRRLLEK